MNELLRVEALTVRRPGPAGIPAALEDVSFAVASGECLGIAGESGSGKTTLIRALCGLEPATTGRVLLGGVDLASLSSRRRRPFARRMQPVFQDPLGALDPRRTVADAVLEPLRVQQRLSRPDGRSRVSALLADVGLPPDLADRYPHELSGGQRQRVSIARALSTGPDLLLLDEPTSALDVELRALVLALLDGLRRTRGLAMVLVSHDLPALRAVADRLLVLDRGRVVETGPSTILDAPQHPHTLALVGSVLPLVPQAARARLHAAVAETSGSQ